MLVLTPFFRIPLAEIEFTYVRSSGPGGQNVNKVSSKCQLRWNPEQSPSIPTHLRDRVLGKLRSRLTSTGDLLLTSDIHRDQHRNREACLEKLAQILREAAAPPKIRKATAPTRGSERRRHESKRVQSQKKTLRGRVRDD